MDDNPYVALELKDEPEWPEGDGHFVFLLEVSGPLEQRLLDGWITRRQPESGAPTAHRARLPQTRRRRQRRRADPRLEAFLSRDDDPLLVPLRVMWFPPSRDGRRTVGWQDLFKFGDPRDPDPIRQHLIIRTRPDRCRIVMGQPMQLSALHNIWADPDGRGQTEGLSLADFAAMRAWLSLERAERALRGNRYKVPKFPRESLTSTKSFATGVAQLAKETGTSYNHMALRTRRYVREIAATHSPYVIGLVAGGFRWIIDRAYVDLRYDREELDAVYQMGQHYPLVFLPSHKSNFDHLILLYVLYENGLPPNHTAGGINMNFFPVGPFLRRSGVFFIRRQFKENAAYKFVLRQYIDYLLAKRFPLEWYIEGSRSRSGKLRPPRLGLLSYVVESFERGAADDVVFIPVSIAYDQIHDVGSYAAEQSGAAKQSESLGWLYRTLRGLRRRYGAAHIRFGGPISLQSFLAAQDDPPVEANDSYNPAITKLAFKVSARINEVTPITPISLVALALLSAGERALTLDQVMLALDPFLAYVAERDLPVTEKLTSDDQPRVVNALTDLADHGVVTRFEGATDVVYRISREQHLAAAYYRNTIIHFFTNSAIAELALVKAVGQTRLATPDEVVDEALRIRDLLKFEFFFAARDEFADQIRSELRYHDPDWRANIVEGRTHDVLETFRAFRSPAILRPFLDAYAVVAEVIESHTYESTLDADTLINEAMALSRQWLLQGKLAGPESVSLGLFSSALQLANNRDLLAPLPDMVERRRGFADEMRDMTHRLEVLETLEAATRSGAVESPRGD